MGTTTGIMGFLSMPLPTGTGCRRQVIRRHTLGTRVRTGYRLRSRTDFVLGRRRIAPSFCRRPREPRIASARHPGRIEWHRPFPTSRSLSPQSHVIQIPVISLASLPGRWLCNETALHRCSRVHHAALQSERPQNEFRTFNAPQNFQGQRRIARKLLIRYGKSWSG